MNELFSKFWNWFLGMWDKIFEFIRANSSNPFFWISLLLLGLIITRLTYEALNKNNGGL